MYPHQAERLEAARARLGVDALVATSAANVAYVSGFRRLPRACDRATGVLAVYTAGGTALVIPALDAPALAAGDAAADHVVCHGPFGLAVAEGADASARRAAALAREAAASADAALARALDALGLTRGAVGLDDAMLPPAAASALAARLKTFTLVPATEALAEARQVKGPYEIECLQQSLHVAEESVHEVLGALEAGITEREAAALLERALARRRARPSSTLIAFGPSTALPTAAPGDRALRPGDLVRIDVGCLFKGYHAEIARVAVLGEPAAPHAALHDAVDAGIDAALAAIRPGAPAGTVFEAVVAAVRGGGLAAFEPLHAGHGIGLEAAESPWLAPGGGPLEAGTVLVVEAAHHELGAVGVQVKETVLVNQAGAAVMNRANRGLVVL
ncbi:MAG TPA: M24 family metallopeptidase [Methylomirabilota bacterium]|nr:M24 family metallopeptidase [Methylomirabilota bacterium]